MQTRKIECIGLSCRKTLKWFVGFILHHLWLFDFNEKAAYGYENCVRYQVIATPMDAMSDFWNTCPWEERHTHEELRAAGTSRSCEVYNSQADEWCCSKSRLCSLQVVAPSSEPAYELLQLAYLNSELETWIPPSTDWEALSFLVLETDRTWVLAVST